MSISAGCARRSRTIPTIQCSSTRYGGLAMSIERADAPHSPPVEQTPALLPLHQWMSEAEIAALRPMLMQVVEHVAASFAGCRCTVQLFEKPDTLRTVVASDMPVGTLGQVSFP